MKKGWSEKQKAETLKAEMAKVVAVDFTATRAGETLAEAKGPAVARGG